MYQIPAAPCPEPPSPTLGKLPESSHARRRLLRLSPVCWAGCKRRELVFPGAAFSRQGAGGADADPSLTVRRCSDSEVCSAPAAHRVTVNSVLMLSSCPSRPLALSVFWDQLPNKPLAPRFLTQGLLLRKRQPVTSHPQAFPHPRPPLGQALSVRAPRGPRAPAMAWVSPEDPDPLLLPLSVPTLT